MGSVHSHATVYGLVQLQRIDDRRLRILRRLEEGPVLVEKRGARHRQGLERIEKARDRIAHLKSDVKQLELDLGSKEKEIEKLLGQQNSARTNQEYKALGDHAERLRTACGEIEDRVLEGLSQVESAQGELDTLTRGVDELGKEQAEFAASWTTDEAEYKKELAAVEAERAAAIAELPKDAVLLYERALQAHHGEAVVAAEQKVCGACRMAILPNDLAQLRGGNALIFCNSCQRILYVPGIHDAAHA